MRTHIIVCVLDHIGNISQLLRSRVTKESPKFDDAKVGQPRVCGRGNGPIFINVKLRRICSLSRYKGVGTSMGKLDQKRDAISGI